MNLRLPIFLLFAAIIALGGGYFVFTLQKQYQDGAPVAMDGVMATQANLGGAFSLVDHEGNRVSEESLVGKHHLVYFGYTFCPDVCPTSLLEMVNAYSLLPENLQENIQPLFITVDPKRDTVEQLASYIGDFHQDLIGFTGTVEEITQMKKNYKVYSRIEEDAERITDGTYLVNHSSFFYLLDEQGQFVQLFSDTIGADNLARYLQQYVSPS